MGPESRKESDWRQAGLYYSKGFKGNQFKRPGASAWTLTGFGFSPSGVVRDRLTRIDRKL